MPAVERMQVRLVDLDTHFVQAPGESRTELHNRHRKAVRNGSNLDRYVKAMRNNGNFPPIIVVKIGTAYFVVDGHHRCCATAILGRRSIDTIVITVHSAAQEKLALNLAIKLTEAGWYWEMVVRAICLMLDTQVSARQAA